MQPPLPFAPPPLSPLPPHMDPPPHPWLAPLKALPSPPPSGSPFLPSSTPVAPSASIVKLFAAPPSAPLVATVSGISSAQEALNKDDSSSTFVIVGIFGGFAACVLVISLLCLRHRRSLVQQQHAQTPVKYHITNLPLTPKPLLFSSEEAEAMQSTPQTESSVSFDSPASALGGVEIDFRAAMRAEAAAGRSPRSRKAHDESPGTETVREINFRAPMQAEAAAGRSPAHDESPGTETVRVQMRCVSAGSFSGSAGARQAASEWLSREESNAVTRKTQRPLFT